MSIRSGFPSKGVFECVLTCLLKQIAQHPAASTIKIEPAVLALSWLFRAGRKRQQPNTRLTLHVPGHITNDQKGARKLIHSQDWKIRILALLHLAQSSCSDFEHLQISAKELPRNDRNNSGLSDESDLYACITRKGELKRTSTSVGLPFVFGTGGAPHLQLVDGRFKISVKSWQINISKPWRERNRM